GEIVCILIATMPCRAGRVWILTGPRLDAALLAVTLLVVTTTVGHASIGTGEGGDSHSPLRSPRAAIPQTSLPTQSEQVTKSSSDAVVESLERALSDGKTEKAHDLLVQVLKRPHLPSDFLLRVGIQFAQR